MLYTSYFSKIKYIEKPLAISAGRPNFYQGPVYWPLAPETKRILWPYKNGEIGEERYVELYYEIVLSPLDPHATYQDILDNHGQAVLLCWEGRGKFCHRHIVADWFKQAGLEIEELDI